MISYLKSPTTEEISTHNSLIIPPIEPVKILYISINGDEISIVERTSLGFVKENEKVLSIIAPTTKRDEAPCQVNMPDTMNKAINKKTHILLDAHI